jgi:hypothetical protein
VVARQFYEMMLRKIGCNEPSVRAAEAASAVDDLSRGEMQS